MLSGIGRQELIVIVEEAPSTISARGTKVERGPSRKTRVKAVISQRDVIQEDNKLGGNRRTTMFEFYIPENTIEYPLEIAQRLIQVKYKGSTFLVREVRNWTGSHQVIKAELPEAR